MLNVCYRRQLWVVTAVSKEKQQMHTDGAEFKQTNEQTNWDSNQTQEREREETWPYVQLSTSNQCQSIVTHL